MCRGDKTDNARAGAAREQHQHGRRVTKPVPPRQQEHHQLKARTQAALLDLLCMAEKGLLGLPSDLNIHGHGHPEHASNGEVPEAGRRPATVLTAAKSCQSQLARLASIEPYTLRTLAGATAAC